MKKMKLALAILFALPLYGGQNPFSNLSSDIIESRAETVLDQIKKKKMDKSSLEIGAELAQKVLKERKEMARTIEDWVWGAIGLAGLAWMYFEKEPIYKYIAPVFFGNLIYAFWWNGPQYRCNRAQLIADVFDREMGITRDPCESEQPVEGK